MRSSFLLHPLLTVVLAVGLTACNRPSGDPMAEARDRLAKNDDAGAMIVLKNILQRNPDSAEARYQLGLQMQKRSDHASALVELQRALTLGHADHLVVPAMARSLLAQGDTKKIVQQYANFELTDALANAELRSVVAQALHAQGSVQSANELIKKAAAAAPASESVQLVTARFAAQEGRLDEAAALLDALIAKKPDSHLAWNMKGNVLAALPAKRDAAADAYRKALQIKADAIDPRTGLIALSLQKRDFATADKELAELQKVAPNEPNTTFYEATSAYAKADYPRARALFQAVLRDAPDQPAALLGAAETELRLNAASAAEKLAAKALRVAPTSARARQILAMVYLRTGQPARVLSTLDGLVGNTNISPEVLAIAAQAHLMNGNAAAADQLYARLAALNPNDPGLRTVLATANLGRTGNDQVYQALERISAEDKDTSADLAIISARLRDRQPDAALKAVEVLIQKRPEEAMGYQLKAQVLAQKNDLPGAQQALAAALAKNPTYLPAVLGLAAMDVRNQKTQQARERIEELLKKDPTNSQALVALAELSIEAGLAPDVVLGYLERAVAIDRGDATLWMALIDQQVKFGDARAALASSQLAVAANPDSIQLLDRLGRAQARTGQAEQALSTFRSLTKQHPNSLVGLQGEAEVLIAGGKLSEAARNINKVLERDPQNLPALNLAFGSALQQKEYKAATDVARKVQGLRPAEAFGTLMEAEAEYAQGRADSAIALWRKALSLGSPGPAPVKLHLALVKAGKESEAKSFVSSWLKDHPADVSLLEHLALQARQAGQGAQAEKHYREILNRQPNHGAALNDLAMLLTQQGSAEAVPLAEKALKRSPDNPAMLDTLAHALAATKQWPAALETQRRAVTLAPNVPSLRLALAQLELQSGDKTAAKRSLSAVQNNPAPLSAEDTAALNALLKALNPA